MRLCDAAIKGELTFRSSLNLVNEQFQFKFNKLVKFILSIPGELKVHLYKKIFYKIMY